MHPLSSITAVQRDPSLPYAYLSRFSLFQLSTDLPLITGWVGDLGAKTPQNWFWTWNLLIHSLDHWRVGWLLPSNLIIFFRGSAFKAMLQSSCFILVQLFSFVVTRWCCWDELGVFSAGVGCLQLVTIGRHGGYLCCQAESVCSAMQSCLLIYSSNWNGFKWCCDFLKNLGCAMFVYKCRVVNIYEEGRVWHIPPILHH